MKKIYFLVSNDLSHDQRMIRICSSLQKNGYDCHLIGRQLPNSKPIENQCFTQHRLKLFFKKGKFFYLELNIRLFFYLLFKNFNAVCAIDLDTILPAFYVCKWKKKPLIYDAHEYFTEVPELLDRPKTKKIWEWVAQKTVPNLTYAYTVGQNLVEILSLRYKIKFELIRNVPFKNHNFNSPIANNPQFIILYQGALNQGRGLEEAIDAMQLVENAVFWIAGEGDLSMELRQKVVNQKLSKKVIFLGYLSPKELKIKTLQADIGLNLLENKSLNYYYSLANKCFDYIQCNKPAINMNYPEYQCINADFECSLLIENLEIETIAKTINTLKNDKNLYNILVENCKKAAEIYHWENEELKLLDFYNKINL